MTTTNQIAPATPGEQLVEQYRERLRRATAALPRGRRKELLDQIEGHLSETVGDGRGDEDRVRAALAELGEPEEIADAARSEFDRPRRTRGELVYDLATAVVLFAGGFVVPVLGWIAGLIMLWQGPRWTRREKWLGALSWPVALAVIAIVGQALHRTWLADHSFPGHGLDQVTIAVAVAMALAGCAFLGWAPARRRTLP